MHVYGTVRKLDRSLFDKSDSTVQYNTEGGRKFKGSKKLRQTQVYPPKFGRAVSQTKIQLYACYVLCVCDPGPDPRQRHRSWLGLRYALLSRSTPRSRSGQPVWTTRLMIGQMQSSLALSKACLPATLWWHHATT